jgi:hypothetical protein
VPADRVAELSAELGPVLARLDEAGEEAARQPLYLARIALLKARDEAARRR